MNTKRMIAVLALAAFVAVPLIGATRTGSSGGAQFYWDDVTGRMYAADAPVQKAYRLTITGTSKLLWGPDANLTCAGAPATLPDNLCRLSIAPETTAAGVVADNIRFNFAGAATATTTQFQLGGTVLNIGAPLARTTQVISEANTTMYATLYVAYPN